MALRWIALGALVACCMSTAHAEEGDFFPLEVGNRWVFQKYDVRYPDTLRVEEGVSKEFACPFLPNCSPQVSTEVIGQVQLQARSYFVVRQDWNQFLPDTLYLRKEGAQVFRYIEQPDTVAAGTLAQDWDRPEPHPLDPNQTDWLMYDFEAPQGTFWDLPLQDLNPPDPLSVDIWWVLVNARWPGDIGPPNWEGTIVQVAPSQRFFRFSATVYVVEWDEVFEVGVGLVYITHSTDDTEGWDFGLLKEAHIGGQTIVRNLTTSVEQTSWGQVKTSPGDRSMPANRAYEGR